MDETTRVMLGSAIRLVNDAGACVLDACEDMPWELKGVPDRLRAAAEIVEAVDRRLVRKKLFGKADR